jgi:hypothetical protein
VIGYLHNLQQPRLYNSNSISQGLVESTTWNIQDYIIAVVIGDGVNPQPGAANTYYNISEG